MPTLAERCRPIELLVLDVDGVLTPGGIVQSAGPESLGAVEWKQFHVRDGLGLGMWHRAGKQTVLLSGRVSPVTAHRAAEVGVREVLQGVTDKAAALRQVLERRGLDADRMAYVGDDLIDVPALRLAGLAVAVADACPEAVAAAHHVTLRPGGCAAVREVIERILRCQGLWPEQGR